jgi:transposase
VIPPNRTRARHDDHDRHLYNDRSRVERYFNKLKHFRRIATRRERTARAYLSMVQLAAAVISTR